MLFGLVGSGLMMFAGLLALRKRYPTAQFGRMSLWLKGHLWLGLLGVAFIVFHSAFRLGGAVEIALWLALLVIVASGIFGLIMQAFVPRLMTDRVPMETIFEEIPHVCLAMRAEADAIVEGVCGPLSGEQEPASKEAKPKGRGKKPIVAVAGSRPLLEYYLQQVRPFLEPTFRRTHRLANAADAEATFVLVLKRLPSELRPTLEQLATFCEERRQLALQVRLHYWLHGWLYLHVPFSYSLLVLGIAHAVMAISY